MRKILALFLMFSLMAVLAGCATGKKNDTNLVHKTYLGTVAEISENSITINSSTTLNMETFLITESTLDIAERIAVGDEVVIESEFETDAEKPYFAIMVTRDE